MSINKWFTDLADDLDFLGKKAVSEISEVTKERSRFIQAKLERKIHIISIKPLTLTENILFRPKTVSFDSYGRVTFGEHQTIKGMNQQVYNQQVLGLYK